MCDVLSYLYICCLKLERGYKYQAVVIFLVETQCLMADICEIGPSNTSKLAAPVASEAHPVTSSSLQYKVESQLSYALQSQGGQEHGLEVIILNVRRIRLALVVDSSLHFLACEHYIYQYWSQLCESLYQLQISHWNDIQQALNPIDVIAHTIDLTSDNMF